MYSPPKLEVDDAMRAGPSSGTPILLREDGGRGHVRRLVWCAEQPCSKAIRSVSFLLNISSLNLFEIIFLLIHVVLNLHISFVYVIGSPVIRNSRVSDWELSEVIMPYLFLCVRVCVFAETMPVRAEP